MKIYLVGGAVRNKLLGLKVIERDWVVVGSSVQEMLDLDFIQVGKNFPVFLHPKTKEEYALARTEQKISRGYQGFEFNSHNVSLEEDLLRRDLTINAIAQDEFGNIIDPYGGQQDLKERKLKAVSDAFVEDPVRVLRVARFVAQLGEFNFQVDQNTHLMMQRMVQNGEVDALVAERVWQETKKALATENPEKYFLTLRLSGALARILPEIDNLFGVPQTKKYHPEIDVGVHTMMVLQQACILSPKLEVRFASLVHDLGKGSTPSDILPSHYGHESRGVDLVKSLAKRLKLPNKYLNFALLVTKYHGYYHKVEDELRPNTIVKLLDSLGAFSHPERFQDFLLACEADQRGRLHFEDLDYPHREIFNQIFSQASKITAKPFVEQGLIGNEIKQAIYQARVNCVSKLVKTLRQKHSEVQ